MSEQDKAPLGPVWMLAGVGSAMLASKLMFDTAVRVHRAGRPVRLLMGAAPFAMAGWMLSRMGTGERVSVLPAEGGPAPERKRSLDAMEAELITEPVALVEAATEAVAEADLVLEAFEPEFASEPESNPVAEAAPEGEPAPEEFEAEIIAEPQPPVETADNARPTALGQPRHEGADDLKRIKGIGPKLEGQLNELGYFHFDQIASWGPEELAWIDENLQGFTGRATRDEWIEQARTLAGGSLLN